MTLTERRILANQFRILALLTKGDSASDDHAAKAEALERGYEAHFDDEWFTNDEEVLSKEQCQEVTATLSMFEDLLLSFGRLADKTGIPAEKVNFPGYDGNDETKYMAYARYFCETYDGGRRFQNLRSSDGFAFNSHRSSVPLYRAMLRKHRAIREAKRSAGSYEPLTKAEIEQVLAAQ